MLRIFESNRGNGYSVIPHEDTRWVSSQLTVRSVSPISETF